ncbi:MAG TPA: glycosyltransferase [Mycobacteriales bacterium]|jgi:glycosyltransferase involved in cell wall biosynthesis|nr:glycosyltransferase [Mycobacteriales bacterium]
MPRVSVFTPSHDPTYLDGCYASLSAQTFTDWEWVVLLNGKAQRWSLAQPDERVRIEHAPNRIKGVGAAKHLACEHATGELLVELDHDDVITPDCLAKVVEAFDANPHAVLVFSDFAQIEPDDSPNQERFAAEAGWVYSEVAIDGVSYLQCHSLEASPHNVAHIWYAPNHVRAFRRSAYEAIGGYNTDLVVLDDQDLMMRLYEIGDFVRIPECLYLQRVHPRNTQRDPKLNAEIQQQTIEQYRVGIEPLTLSWASRHGLEAVHLTTPTSVAVAPFDDRFTSVTIDPANPTLPFGDNEVGAIKAIDVLTRIPDRAAFLNECYRVLTHGGLLLSDTPSTDGRGAFQDPSNVAFYNENSFSYLTQEALRPAVPGLTARFQISHLVTYYPTAEHEQLGIPYVKANLIAIKDGPRQGGTLLV